MFESLFAFIVAKVLPEIEDKGWAALSPKVKSVFGVLASAEKSEFIAAAKKTPTNLDDLGLGLIYEDIQTHFASLGKPNLCADLDEVVSIPI